MNRRSFIQKALIIGAVSAIPFVTVRPTLIKGKQYAYLVKVPCVYDRGDPYGEARMTKARSLSSGKMKDMIPQKDWGKVIHMEIPMCRKDQCDPLGRVGYVGWKYTA